MVKYLVKSKHDETILQILKFESIFIDRQSLKKNLRITIKNQTITNLSAEIAFLYIPTPT